MTESVKVAVRFESSGIFFLLNQKNVGAGVPDSPHNVSWDVEDAVPYGLCHNLIIAPSDVVVNISLVDNTS